MASQFCTIMGHFQIWCCAIVLAVCIGQLATASSTDTQDIAIGLIVGDKGSNGARAGVENAANEVNKRTDLLSDYRLKFIPLSVDSEVI